MTGSFSATLGDIPGKKAMVVSHPRSGTHFLMNTLAANFGYVADPWLNLDIDRAVNIYSTEAMRGFFSQMHDKPMANVIKSHHSADFFSELMEYLVEQFHVFYIYRDPRDTMRSCWRMYQDLTWDAGPRTETVGEFMRAEPRGGVLRHQKQQFPTMLQRWQRHVEDWMALADAHSEIIVVQYEALNHQFEAAVKTIGDIVGRPVDTPTRPGKTDNVILPGGGGKTGSHRDCFTDADYAFVRETVGETMERYAMPWGSADG